MERTCATGAFAETTELVFGAKGLDDRVAVFERTRTAPTFEGMPVSFAPRWSSCYFARSACTWSGTWHRPTFAALLRSPRTRRGPGATPLPATFSLSLPAMPAGLPSFVATAFWLLMTAELDELTLASMLEGRPPAFTSPEVALESTVSSTLIDLASGARLALLVRGCCDTGRGLPAAVVVEVATLFSLFSFSLSL